jgi:hypothetical protein
VKTTARPWPTCILAIVSVAVLYGCSTSTPGSAGPATTSSVAATTSASASSAGSSPVPSSAATPTTSSAAERATTTRTTDGAATSSEPSSEKPAPSGTGPLPTDLSGVVYGFVRGVDAPESQLTLDKVDWFTGAAAQQACDEDGVPQEARVDEWCSMYYFRNVNPTLRVVTVSPHVAVTTLDGNVQVAGDLAALADRITTPTGSSRPYQLTVTDGVVTEVVEMYQP